ncbi:DUF3040 domain-containing protein [Agilicoccus flavus]|uniref:DUF3040 domain-containing protein n=1 Tax=Agilicoccus flavus TaxID=2775968 RepID=UPI001CF66E5F|nr:DUF3040 domain-containing protein [Agilicoccus flavus]
MPLSENEQKLLEQMERALYAEDPRFASQMKGSRMTSASKRRIVVGSCAVLAGLGLVIGGVAAELVALGVVGFVVMVAGVAWAVTPARQSGGPASVGPDGTTSRPRRSKRGSSTKGAKGAASSESFTQRMEGRWEKRRREGQGF